MKENEVMVGDWFRYRYTIENREIIRTFRISRIENELKKYYVWGDGFGRMCYPERLEPIPLTPEILEKNGWFYPKQSSWMKLDNPHRELWGCIHTDGTLWLYSSGDCDKDESFAEIKYVHELQHCLKLVGIDKEITI